MVMETIVAGAVTAMVALLGKAAQPLAERAGEKVARAASSLLQVVKSRVKGDTYAEQTLARLEEQPEDEGRQAGLKSVLSELMTKDAQFKDIVDKLVSEIKEADSRNVIAWGEGSVAIGGDSERNIIVTGDNNIIH